ncbi:MAG TPA: UDP-3-O-acyl-N-acetylglucosamine deacetylase [Gemmataceae bacterium]|nr:UDP-3-O-acyl-N-acetylglucosamine deacetylase [Gemmataceae bacterium]
MAKEDANVRRVCYRYQRTIARAAEVQGIGYLTGANVRLRFLPAPPHTGVVFVRTDIGPTARVEACVENVTGTNRRTTLGEPPVSVSLVEHVLAALAGLRIDNCVLEVNAPEPPGLDGSARNFVEALHNAGVRLLPARREVWCVETSVVLGHHGATLALHPSDSDDLRVSYLLDYGRQSPLSRQSHTQAITPASFTNDLADCRTFLLEEEAIALRRQGLGARTSVSDLLVFGLSGPIGNSLRYANEPARHKILDLIGDLSLLGQDVRGRLVAYRSGHPLNVELVRALSRQLPQACGMARKAA